MGVGGAVSVSAAFTSLVGSAVGVCVGVGVVNFFVGVGVIFLVGVGVGVSVGVIASPPPLQFG